MRLLGTMTAIVTPFDAEGRVDEEALRRHIHFQLDAGIDGLIPCGTTGETPTLTLEEYRCVVTTTLEEVRGRIPVIAGTGSNDTRKTIEWTRMARDLGVDAALVVTPYYNKPGPTMLEAHYRAVAAEGGLPVVLYNVPGRTGCNLQPETVRLLAEIDNIVALKEASGNLTQVQQILQDVDRDDFTLLSGDDGLALAMYSVGAHGVISVAANVVPAEMKSILVDHSAGQVQTAAATNRRLFPLFEALFCEPNPVPAKAALHRLGRMNSVVRGPLGPLQAESAARIDRVLAQLGLL